MVAQKKITLILSGGIDSTTLLFYCLSQTSNKNIKTLSFYYGQKHRKELQRAKRICRESGITNELINISVFQRFLQSSLTSNTMVIPQGHYAEDTMKQTVVPNRNAIMLSIAYAYAISTGADELLYGPHAGDHFIYPDCRPEFVAALDNALQLGNKGVGAVKLRAPFLEKTKIDIVRLGKSLGVPYEKTWSCYVGANRPCLRCGTCIERTEAFLYNDFPDPLLAKKEWYEAVTIYRQMEGKRG